MGSFSKVGTVLKRVAPKPRTRYEKICRCGHSKTMHEAYPCSVEMGEPSGTVCLCCDCPVYKYGSRRIVR